MSTTATDLRAQLRDLDAALRDCRAADAATPLPGECATLVVRRELTLQWLRARPDAGTVREVSTDSVLDSTADSAADSGPGAGTAGETTRLTARGQATRERIVEAATNLMYVHGVNATTLDDVRAASGTSKSQLYRHFSDKDALVGAVVARQSDFVLAREQRQLGRLNSMAGLQRWRDALIHLNRLQGGAYGCALGAMSNELADQDEPARASLNETFQTWEHLIAAGLRRMRDAGRLQPSADPDALAIGLMAALQGGYLLARTAHDTEPMRIALDMALAHIRTQLSD